MHTQDYVFVGLLVYGMAMGFAVGLLLGWLWTKIL